MLLLCTFVCFSMFPLSDLSHDLTDVASHVSAVACVPNVPPPFETTSLHTALHAASCSGCELHMFWRMVRMLCCMLRCMLLRRIMCMLRRVLRILCPHAAHVRVELNVAVQLRTFSRCLHMLPRTVLRIMFLSFPMCSHATESACRAHFPQQVFAHSHFMLKLSTARRSERKACGLCEAKHPRCS